MAGVDSHEVEAPEDQQLFVEPSIVEIAEVDHTAMPNAPHDSVKHVEREGMMRGAEIALTSD